MKESNVSHYMAWFFCFSLLQSGLSNAGSKIDDLELDSCRHPTKIPYASHDFVRTMEELAANRRLARQKRQERRSSPLQKVADSPLANLGIVMSTNAVQPSYSNPYEALKGKSQSMGALGSVKEIFI